MKKTYFLVIGLLLISSLSFAQGELNLAGDVETLLGFAADWDPADVATDLTETSSGSGIYSISGTSSATGTYQYKITLDHAWDTSYPGSNVNVDLENGVAITFYIDTNAVTGWYPESNAVYDTDLASHTTWQAVGGFNGWDNNDPTNLLNDTGVDGDATGGDGIYTKHVIITAAGTNEAKITETGDWVYQFGSDGIGSNSGNVSFDTTVADEQVRFECNVNDGRMRIVPEGVTPVADWWNLY
jgi:hypothetical protein